MKVYEFMIRYTPNSILLPAEILQHPSVFPHVLQTMKYVRKGQGDGMFYHREEDSADNLLSEEEKTQYILSGKFVYFHDVFLNCGSSQIVAIGVNHGFLDDMMSLPQIWCDGKQVNYNIRSLVRGNNSIRFLIANCDNSLDANSSLTVEFKWPDSIIPFSKTLQLQPNPWQGSSSKLTLRTLQRDNPMEWIRDWILYHHRIHSVERVLLYDNVSNSKCELVDYLPTLESERLEICLVDWDISHSPRKLSDCQVGQLSHAI